MRLGCAMSLTTVLVATTALLPRNLLAAAPVPTTLHSLTAFLSVAPEVSTMSTRAMIAEIDRIWRREGVRLTWPIGDGPTTPLRVMVYSRSEAVGRGERWPVAELVPQQGRRALAVASVAGAERVLREARRSLRLQRPEPAEYRLGVVLGRAVAHEIGHYLLDTATHSDRGLMRAAIAAQEFADPGARTFTLDDRAGAWLRDSLSQAGDGSLPASPFSYDGSQPSASVDR